MSFSRLWAIHQLGKRTSERDIGLGLVQRLTTKDYMAQICF